MNQTTTILPRSAVREIVRVPRNETPDAKLYRVIVATVRQFATEYPVEAKRIVEEIVDKDVVK